MHWRCKPAIANRKNLIKKNNFNPELQRSRRLLIPSIRLDFCFSSQISFFHSLFSLFFAFFLNSQFLIEHRLAILDSIIKIQNSLHLPSNSLNSGSLWNTCWSLAIVVSPLSSPVSHNESLPGDSQSSHHHPEAVTFGSPN
jgi:hypothetical protein